MSRSIFGWDLPPAGAAKRSFADEETRLGYETFEAVSQLLADLPLEGPDLTTRAITFEGLERRDRIRGLSAIFSAGTVIGTGMKGVLLVPERTLKVLRQLGIPYRTPEVVVDSAADAGR